MEAITNIFQIGLLNGLVWFPLVLCIGILYKYLKIIDVSIDGIAVVSAITFTYSFNYTNSPTLAFVSTFVVASSCYLIMSWLINELKINSLLSGILFSLVLHAISVILIGESAILNYSAITYLNKPLTLILVTLIIIILFEFFTNTRLGIKAKVITDNPKIFSRISPRFYNILIYFLCALFLSVGIILYTTKIGMCRSGGGFEFLITSLSSFLFIDRLLDLLVKMSPNSIRTKPYYYYLYSFIQSPVFKALIGSVLFQIIILLIVFYTNNPAYWKLIFGLTLVLLVAKPHTSLNKKKSLKWDSDASISLNNISFAYTNGYENRVLFDNFNVRFSNGINIISGGNGIGKTTLIKLIKGDLKPSKGTIIANGINITNSKSLYKNVFLFSQVSFNSFSTESSVFENLIAVKPYSKTEIFKFAKVNEIIHDIKIFELDKTNQIWKQSAGNLSGGQAQKLNTLLCRNANPEIILADEPSSGLDDKSFDMFKDFIEEQHKLGKLIIIVTHDSRLLNLRAKHFKMTTNRISYESNEK
jgi:ABC-type Mn2+/Zn2+ transport system ATPase subunit/ABC-type uncharacterized transport system permease subunit